MIFALNSSLRFPDPEYAEEDGLLAWGGDLSAERLLLAYSNGIFPWYEEDSPVLWWSPDPRFVLFPGNMKVSASLRQTLRSNKFTVRADTCFADVIGACAAVTRKHEKGTWITVEMQQAYIRLHREGYAHSIEVFEADQLAGGLYGVSIGAAFFGESMFHNSRDASKVALYFLDVLCRNWGFSMIDAQVYTGHLESLGAQQISRKEYLAKLEKSCSLPTHKGPWTRDFHQAVMSSAYPERLG